MPLRLVLFDLLGTLVEEEATYEALDRTMAEAAERYELDATPGQLSGEFSLALMEILHDEPDPRDPEPAQMMPFDEAAKGVFAGLLEHHGFVAAPEDTQWFWDRYGHHQKACVRLVPGAEGALRALKRGGVRVGIVTDADPQLVALLGPTLGVGRWIDFTVTAQEAGYVKPNPRLFLHALDRGGALAEDAAMVGDSYERDLEGARAAGIPRLVLVDRYDARTVEVPRVRDLRGLAGRLLGRG